MGDIGCCFSLFNHEAWGARIWRNYIHPLDPGIFNYKFWYPSSSCHSSSSPSPTGPGAQQLGVPLAQVVLAQNRQLRRWVELGELRALYCHAVGVGQHLEPLVFWARRRFAAEFSMRADHEEELVFHHSFTCMRVHSLLEICSNHCYPV